MPFVKCPECGKLNSVKLKNCPKCEASLDIARASYNNTRYMATGDAGSHVTGQNTPWGQPAQQPAQQPQNNPWGQPAQQPAQQPQNNPWGQPAQQPAQQPQNNPWGQPVTQNPELVTQCPTCGNRIAPGARFCASCGTQIPQAATRPAGIPTRKNPYCL